MVAVKRIPLLKESREKMADNWLNAEKRVFGSQNQSRGSSESRVPSTWLARTSPPGIQDRKPRHSVVTPTFSGKVETKTR